MRILVIGSGAREHALAWKCMQSVLTDRVFCAPGNGGTGGMAKNIQIPADDVANLVKFAKNEKISLVVLGPESAVAAGVGDALRAEGIPAFGPNRDPGRIESSKAFAKDLMRRAGIPTADFGVFTEAGPAKAWAAERDGRVVVKADGLALGKGVIVCGDREEADRAIEAMLVERSFGRSGSTAVVEERLEGAEVSLMAITDGTRVIPLAPARDFKRVGEGDTGPNTGGMGAFSPLPEMTDELITEAVSTVLEPAVRQLAADGFEYRGLLYAGLMLTPLGIRVLEFNARFGDPEAQVVLPRLRSDCVRLLLEAARGDLSVVDELDWDPRPCVGVVLASSGYPESYETGFPIDGLANVNPGVLVFHAGTRYLPGQGLVTSGGRVLTFVALGDTLADARAAVLGTIGRVRFKGAFHRRDIALETSKNG
ncbi:MAG TPA: phosphoribosylamine--glycine ligase [Candidatus Dormibacteraeota bacterium]|nr:phosphoribosylamine--glycine ligase [Candidatus Dormibacteraeota bacterium]